ncbi:MAG TPA: nucleotidyl transferase AbiEii/AbiGii toxin family protein [Gammaproteobacteria bacterium]|nr:nucleotidyl transferase AbiEii/AbiGii toxin family protein [Gammaproteobacteria bacterium]
MYTSRELREVFHFCFLERLLKVADANLFVLKGGVNLRFYFRSPRYSEDMDVDVVAGSVATIKKNGYKVLEDAALRRTLRTYGIADVQVNDPDKAKHTDTTQRFRVQLVTVSGERLPSKVEFSRRVSAVAGGREVALVDTEIARRYQRLAFRCQHYDGATAAAQKVLALAGRPVTQARDVFDLDLLQRGGHTRNLTLRTLVSAEKCAAAAANLRALTYDDFAGQVLEFVDDEERREFGGTAAWRAMVEHVEELVRAP